MYDRFTERARRIMDLALGEARKWAHESIGSEHLLLGLLREGDGAGLDCLGRVGVDCEKLVSTVELRLQQGPESAQAPADSLPFSPDAKRVLEGALEAATTMRHTYVGSEHILMGLIAEPSTASSALADAGAEIRAVVAELAALLCVEPEAEEAAPCLSDLARKPDPLADELPQFMRAVRFTVGRWRHDAIGTEHLLLAVLHEGAGLAVTALEACGIDIIDLADAVERRMKLGARQEPMGQLPFTPRARGTLELAERTARGLDHAHVGPEHVFLALLRDDDGNAAQALRSLGVPYDAVRREIVARTGGSPQGSASAAPRGTSLDATVLKAHASHPAVRALLLRAGQLEAESNAVHWEAVQLAYDLESKKRSDGEEPGRGPAA